MYLSGTKTITKTTAIAVTAILLSVSISVCTVTPALAAGADETVTGLVDEFRQHTKCDSVSVAVVKDGEVHIYGDPDALYQIGSMTKAFTGLGIRKLIADGILSEDDKISDYLPGFMVYYENKPCDITIRHLLTQTSGFTNMESAYPSAAAGMSLMEWADSISGSELAASPGTEYAYSNANYNLLGALIEQASGRSYEEFMENEILLPLGLGSTYVHVPDDRENVVSGSRLGYRQSIKYDISVIEGRIPAGYFYSDIEDMAGWIKIWTGTADIPEEYRNLVDAVKNELHEPGDYHSGWELFENGTTGHSGGTPNFSSRIVFSDRDDIGVCVLTNLNVAASTDGLCNEIYAASAGETRDGIPADVWTVFDIVFLWVSIAGIMILVYAIFGKKRRASVLLGVAVLMLFSAICIVMPIVFGAGLGEIVFTWAPYSFAGALLILVIDMIVIAIRLWMKFNEDRKKAG